jgi:hypothetical protein
MSHSPGWRMSIRSLAKANGTGIDTIKTAVSELEQFGYLVRGEDQNRSDDGTFADYEWKTADPFQNPVTGKSRHGETGHKEEQDSKEEKSSKNNERTNAHFEAQFEEFWNAYPRKLDKAKAFRAFKSALTRAKFEDVLAGVLAYRNDPKRNPDFTKYPASWLNADSWENAAGSNEVIQATNERREREIAHSKQFLEEQKAQASAPAPKCPHGSSIVRCEKCLKTIG